MDEFGVLLNSYLYFLNYLTIELAKRIKERLRFFSFTTAFVQGVHHGIIQK